jgi:hypothetical protein
MHRDQFKVGSLMEVAHLFPDTQERPALADPSPPMLLQTQNRTDCHRFFTMQNECFDRKRNQKDRKMTNKNKWTKKSNKSVTKNQEQLRNAVRPSAAVTPRFLSSDRKLAGTPRAATPGCRFANSCSSSGGVLSEGPGAVSPKCGTE